MKGYIYKITNEINDKVYIGKTTTSIEERFQHHCNDSTKRICEKRPLYDAMNKYGIDKFHIELVQEYDNITDEELNNKEIYWIEYFHSYSNGYNATFGGDGRTLYDYDFIVQEYLDGKLGKDIAANLHCDISVVKHALQNAGISTHQNIYNQLKQKIIGFFPDGSEHIFESASDAARWLQQNNYTKAKQINGIVTNISRAAKGKNNRKSYLKIKWEYI